MSPLSPTFRSAERGQSRKCLHRGRVRQTGCFAVQHTRVRRNAQTCENERVSCQSSATCKCRSATGTARPYGSRLASSVVSPSPTLLSSPPPPRLAPYATRGMNVLLFLKLPPSYLSYAVNKRCHGRHQTRKLGLPRELPASFSFLEYDDRSTDRSSTRIAAFD